MFPLIPPREEIRIEGFHTVYYFEFGKFHYHSPESHDFWEMVYVDKGRILANTDGSICTLEAGKAIFHCPGQEHSHISNKEVSNNLLVVSFSCHSPCMKFFGGKIFTLDKTGKTLLSLFINEAKNALGEIQSDFHSKKPLDFSSELLGASRLMELHFTELLIKLMRGDAAITDVSPSSSWPRTESTDSLSGKIIEYLSENVYNSITLSDICNSFYMRKSRLSALFKEQTGTSPMSFFKKLKIEEAKKLLREQDISVSQICDRLGYSSIHNFTRAFKTVTGFSPTEYKKSIFHMQE